MLAWLCARIRLLSWWAASWPPTNVAACDKGTGTSQRVARIQELVSVRNWLARDQGTALASSRSGNGNWPARDQGTGTASARPGNGIGELGGREGKGLASARSRDREWPTLRQ